MNLNLYSVYSYPNMILCFFGGYIVDRYNSTTIQLNTTHSHNNPHNRVTGVRWGSILFCGFILLGEFMFCLGIQFKMYYLALVGRFVFGLGGESLTVAQNTYTARWFDGIVFIPSLSHTLHYHHHYTTTITTLHYTTLHYTTLYHSHPLTTILST